jgi:peptide/nickel transport system substrate-binding protein
MSVSASTQIPKTSDPAVFQRQCKVLFEHVLKDPNVQEYGSSGQGQPELDKRLPYDPEAAEALLAEAGYPEGFSVTLDCPNNRYINDEAICRGIAAQLGEVSLALTVNAQPKELFVAKIDNRETDFYLRGWGTYDSYDVFLNFYRTGGGENAPGYSDPRVDELTGTIGQTMVTYARDALIEEVCKIVLGDIVYIPLHYQVIVWAMRDNLEIPVYPLNRPIFREARFTARKVN